jgi:hypothetical protein
MMVIGPDSSAADYSLGLVTLHQDWWQNDRMWVVDLACLALRFERNSVI